MLIRLGYDIRFDIAAETPMIALLTVHPTRAGDLIERDEMTIEPASQSSTYIDTFGNMCTRLVAQAPEIRLSSTAVIEDSGEPDEVNPAAREVPLSGLPPETLRFLLPSRYCEVDLFSNIAYELFGGTQPGWQRVAAICDWVHGKVKFGYEFARSTRTALDAYTERLGVCRDFQHLAITFCRAMNIPARYATGYLGDIGAPPAPSAMDFSAWFQAWLDGRWWTFDARHNTPRIGRVLIAVGRDAADVAITTSFGNATLKRFEVVTNEMTQTAGHGS